MTVIETISPMDQLTRLTHKYPKFWRHIEDYRAKRGKHGHPDWPSWCYCPIDAALAATANVVTVGTFRESLFDTMAIAALSAWRVTKGIYRFDSELSQHLCDTKFNSPIPSDILKRLPEWCVYIEPGLGIQSFFAWLDYSPADTRTQLCVLLFDGHEYYSICTYIAGTIEESLALTAQSNKGRGFDPGPLEMRQAKRILATALNYILYLCAEEPDYSGLEKPGMAQIIAKKKHAAAHAPRIWEVGCRLGAALRCANDCNTYEAGTSSHASPRAHIRRAHWHAYWEGPRGAQRLVLKWLAPILIGAGETVPTIYR